MNEQKDHAMKKKFSGKLRWLIAGIATSCVIAGGAAFYYVSTTKASTATTTETPVQTATAFKGNIVLYANGTGTLAPANAASFGFGTSGKITELDVKIGDTVEAGQVIGQLDNAEALAAYKQAKRTLAMISQHPLPLPLQSRRLPTQKSTIYNAKQDLEHLISSDVLLLGEPGRHRRANAQGRASRLAAANPTADQKKKIDDATKALSRAQTNLQAAQLKYINEYVPATFTYTVTDTEDRDKDGNTEETYTGSGGTFRGRDRGGPRNIRACHRKTEGSSGLSGYAQREGTS